jgi:DNA (cytosine-5)-methyltransferase 1
MIKKIKKYKIVDLFAGCGGLSYGFEMTKRFETVYATDIWNTCLESLKQNNPKTEIVTKPISDISDNDIKKIKSKYGNIKVLVGGPPCQGFSQAGKRDKNDPRNNLYKEYLRFCNILKPEWIVFENVRGMLSMKNADGEKVVDALLKDFKKIGYDVEINSISAKDFGVPQDRKRIIIIGNRIGKKINKLKSVSKTYKTVRDVIGDLEKLESGESSTGDKYHFSINHSKKHIEWLKDVPEGMSAHDFKDKNGMTVKGYRTTYKRIWWDKPSPAITTCFSSISSQNNVHPESTRALTIREAMRIQTFPDNFNFRGSHRDIRVQIGNAVPPKLGFEIAKQLLDMF